MYSVSLTLDKLRMISAADELEVSVNSSVSLICPDRIFLSLESPQLLELLRLGNLWVTRGNGCRLEFTILFNGHKVDFQSREDVIQMFSCYLRDAPLWSQVGLDTKFNLPQSDGSSKSWPCFTIGLRHAFSTGSSPPPGNLELSAAADVKAPAGVACLQLETVKICMNFCSLDTSHTKRLKRSEYSSVLQLPPDSAKFPQEQHKRLDEHGSSDGLFSHRSAVAKHKYQYEDEEMLDEEVLSTQDDSLFSLPSSQSSNASWLVSQSSQESQSRGKDNTRLIIPVSPNINSAQRMAECALRTLIGGRQTKSQPEFKVLKPYSRQTLSQIAPALWSPGFLDAVSQRSRFIPTISHVLSNTCLNNAVSPSLRRKLMDLASKEMASSHPKPVKGHYDQDTIRDLEGRELSDTVDDVIRGRVWRMMQLSLYDPLAARRLRPPQNEGDQRVEVLTENPAIAEDYLCEADHTRDQAQGIEDYSLPPEDEFYNLLDDTSEGEGDSVFDALLDEATCESFEDLLDESQDGFGGARDTDTSGRNTMERNNAAADFCWDDALDMDVIADNDEVQVDDQNMLL